MRNLYEVDAKKFEGSDIPIRGKIQLLAKIHNIPDEVVWNEYYEISDMQMTELRTWQLVNSCLYKQKGVIF